MIDVEEKFATVETNFTGENVAAWISPEAIPHIMKQLTELYSDRELACIREYSTNADDSHKAVGQTRPIEVTTPNALTSPLLVIKDFGEGISAQDIRSIYSSYGMSTKRDNVLANGRLGFGCKAAWAYSDQFFVTSVKDGREVAVAINRDESGGGNFTIIHDKETDKPNGTTVSIPVMPNNKILGKAEEFFANWQPGTVLLNGKDPSRIAEYEDLGDGIYRYPVRERYFERTIAMVMGNVTYRVKLYDCDVSAKLNCELIVFCEMGTDDQFKFAPSREAPVMNDRFKAIVARKYEEAVTKTVAEFEKEIDKCATPYEALQYRQNNYSKLFLSSGVASVKYRGEEIPDPNQYHNTSVSVYTTTGFDSDDWSRYEININKMDNRWKKPYEKYDTFGEIVVYGFPTSTPRGLKLGHKAATLYPGRKVYFVVDEEVNNAKWFKDKPVAWEDFDKTEHTYVSPDDGSTPNRYSIVGKHYVVRSVGRRGDSFTQVLRSVEDIIAENKPIYYAEDKAEAGEYWEYINDNEKIIVLRIPPSRLAKAKRDIPNMSPVEDVAKHAMAKIKSTAGIEELLAAEKLSGEYYSSNWPAVVNALYAEGITKVGEHKIIPVPEVTEKRLHLVKNDATLMSKVDDIKRQWTGWLKGHPAETVLTQSINNVRPSNENVLISEIINIIKKMEK